MAEARGGESETVEQKSPRVARGGSFIKRQTYVRSADRLAGQPGFRSYDFGFRPARTYP